ncbi:patatin-like phospholipase domain-containing protein 4 isoform X3 [Bombina bombina]|uniref:patatin-like phospholipase domain-containing protein 4 isoform X3 n=1 Tax=Bombina bombina TaxID=8345 RepID=UPI00235A51E6|nr:patatin-like phospholipase domain-containing protein 4 isoform X3 [Bombina bombina]
MWISWNLPLGGSICFNKTRSENAKCCEYLCWSFCRIPCCRSSFNSSRQNKEEVRKQTLGAFTPRYDFMKRLRGGIQSILPSKAHEVAENRLCISITNTKSRENCLVSNFATREELIKVLLASSFVPVYAGIKAVEYKGEDWIDGSFTNSLPILPMGRTVTVSPFSGRLDICPRDKGHMDIYVNLAKQDTMLSTANLERLKQALFPPPLEKMESLYQEGFKDGTNFLQTENWFE